MTNRLLRSDLPKLYAITDSRLSSLSHAKQVAALCAGGAKWIQLREKFMAAREFYADAKAALEIAHEFGAKLLINDRVDVAMAIGADGVHLGQDDLPVASARLILGEEAIIGFSTHNLSQAEQAAELPFDYLAVGPIFGTKTKENPDPTVGLSELQTIRSRFPTLPIVAIGGVNSLNAAAALNAGADSVAVVSWLISDPDTIQAKTTDFLRQV